MKLGTLSAAIIGLVVFGALASSCSSGTGGNATPTTTTSSTSTDPSSSASESAPKVTVPLDPAKFVTAPCNALTTSDLAGLHIVGAQGKSSTVARSPGCEWSAFQTDNASIGHDVGIDWMKSNPNGLSDLYSLQANQAYWQTTTVDGYPAVFADAADLRSNGTCTINVGVNDSLYFFASYQTTDPAAVPQACSLAQQAASDVIKNLKAG